MNERIRELCIKSGAYDHYEVNEGEVGDMVPMQEFAELIVRECCEVINAAKPGVNQVPAEVALDLTAKNVKAYFGVE